MSKSWAVLQIVVMVTIVVYSTYQFYKGNFELAFSTLPLLMVYYVFVIGRSRKLPPSRSDPPDGDDTAP
jgi:cell division protein FtsW (lipid II flippase)